MEKHILRQDFGSRGIWTQVMAPDAVQICLVHGRRQSALDLPPKAWEPWVPSGSTRARILWAESTQGTAPPHGNAQKVKGKASWTSRMWVRTCLLGLGDVCRAILSSLLRGMSQRGIWSLNRLHLAAQGWNVIKFKLKWSVCLFVCFLDQTGLKHIENPEFTFSNTWWFYYTLRRRNWLHSIKHSPKLHPKTETECKTFFFSGAKYYQTMDKNPFTIISWNWKTIPPSSCWGNFTHQRQQAGKLWSSERNLFIISGRNIRPQSLIIPTI